MDGLGISGGFRSLIELDKRLANTKLNQDNFLVLIYSENTRPQIIPVR